MKALGTKDEREARQRMWPVVEAWHREFDDLRSRRTLTDEDLAHATWSHYSGTLDRDEVARLHAPRQADIDDATRKVFARAKAGELDRDNPLAILDATLDVHVLQGAREFDANFRRVKLEHLRQHLSKGKTALIDDEIEAYARENNLIVDPKTTQGHELARRMMRAEIEAIERTIERDKGDYSGSPRDPIVKPATGTARERAKPGEAIMDLFAIYERENPKAIAQDALNQARRDIGTFVDYVGKSFPVHRIDKRAVREWKALLMRYPVKASESKVFAGMSIAQIVRANDTVGKPVLAPRTVNRYLSSLGAFCSWLVAHGYIEHNPTSDMSLAKKKERSTLPFTEEQLNILFQSPLFTGCQNDREWRFIAKPGNVLIRDHRFWLPLIMLFSGARPAEIAQLAVADVRQQHEHWTFHITPDGGGEKRVKTVGSIRVIPVHSELIRLGFLHYRERVAAAGHANLFPDARRNSRGQMVADFSREFGRYLTRIGLKNGRGLSLYSFRHGVADAFRRAGHLDDQFGFLLGHGIGTMTGRYGSLPQGMLAKRVELIESILYPALTLDHLAPSAAD